MSTSTGKLNRFWSIMEQRDSNNTVTPLHMLTLRLLEADLRCYSFAEKQLLILLATAPKAFKLRKEADAILDRIISVIEDDEHDVHTIDRIKEIATEYKTFVKTQVIV